MPTSQKHGFLWENYIRKIVFGLSEEQNNTDIHDIPSYKNKFDINENVSIKTTCGSNIDCADIIRFFGYDHDNAKHTIICLIYKQLGSSKTIRKIYEIDYSKNMRDYLFGTISLQELQDYVKLVKSIPKGNVSKEQKDLYISEKKRLQLHHNMRINISPKVDSKTQRRVQCSIPNFETTLSEFICYKSPIESPSLLRDIKLPEFCISEKRIRNKFQDKK